MILAAEEKEKVSVSPGRSSTFRAEGLRTVPGLGASAQVGTILRSSMYRFLTTEMYLFFTPSQARLALDILAFTCRRVTCDGFLLEATVSALIRVIPPQTIVDESQWVLADF